MRKGDITWGGLFLCWVLILVIPPSRQIFIDITTAHPYAVAFVKFAVLATMGEFLSLRILNGRWVMPVSPVIRSVIWGLFGMLFVLIFEIFFTGVNSALSKGLLLCRDTQFTGAFFTSAIMNITFAPTFMAFHRLTDTYLDLSAKSGKEKPGLEEIINGVDWNNFISFVCLRTIPIFWIPVHTITFLLPTVYRVIAAAFLSIILGVILTFAKRKTQVVREAIFN
ncbi:MAG: hypothetical protein AAGU27_04760 [Dehalobacterium sp.]